MIACMSRWLCAAVLVLGLVLLAGSAATAAAQCGCAGDCNSDGQVTIDELITLIGMQLDDALGVCGCMTLCADPSICTNIDIVVVQSQFNLFNGCPSSLY